jgi:hypothetical protein
LKVACRQPFPAATVADILLFNFGAFP